MAARKLRPVPDPDPAAKLDLGRHKGRDILSVGMEVRNTGHGLSESVAVDPVQLTHKQRVRVIFECEVEKIRYDGIKDTDGLQEVYMLVALGGTIASPEIDRAVADELEAQAERIRLASEGAAPFPGMSKAGITDPTQDPEADPLKVFDGSGADGDEGGEPE